nr:MAG TPA: hypothetical protein [Caudoviricetes sp.]
MKCRLHFLSPSKAPLRWGFSRCRLIRQHYYNVPYIKSQDIYIFQKVLCPAHLKAGLFFCPRGLFYGDWIWVPSICWQRARPCRCQKRR